MEHENVLKERFDYGAWKDHATTQEELFIWQFFLSGNEFPGWRPYRIQPLPQGGALRSTQSIWQRPENRDDTLLSVLVHELPSREEAHEHLITVLGEFQSPLVTRSEQEVIGDIAFIHGEYTILFARANLVFLIRNGGAALVPVTEIARELDTSLVRRPEAPDVEVIPKISRFDARTAEARVGEDVALELDATDPLNRSLWYKFYSSTGQVRVRQDQLVYTPASAGPQALTVYAINPNGGAARQELQLDVPEVP
jgi:hypothetical protein